MCGHLFARVLATGDGTPLQKTIVFCASDHHADLVTNELNALYSQWVKANGQKRIQNYAFKCMSSVNGQALIPDFRSRKKSHIIATTKDLLTTGVNVPPVRNIVFFRYVQSPILFHQMVGRGTRIDEESAKLMFRIFDYTGATALFGASFITPPPPPPSPAPPPGPPLPPPQRVRVKGVAIEIKDTGRFNLLTRDGRLQRVTPQEYREELIRQLTQSVPTLAELTWIGKENRPKLEPRILLEDPVQSHHAQPVWRPLPSPHQLIFSTAGRARQPIWSLQYTPTGGWLSRLGDRVAFRSHFRLQSS